MTEKSERKADRMYILTERQFIESVLVGATQKRYLPPGIAADAQRCQVETAENGGVVVRIWLGPIESTRALEPQVLQPLLGEYAHELPGPVPTLSQVKAWTESELLDVSQWVRALHAHAHPIAGMILPEVGDQPPVLFEVKPAPMPERRVAKKKVAKKKAAKVHFQGKKERKQIEAARAGAEAARNLLEAEDEDEDDNAANMRDEEREQDQREKREVKKKRVVRQPPPVESKATRATRNLLEEAAAIEHAGGFPRGGGD